MQNRQWSGKFFTLEVNGHERPLLRLLHHRRIGHDSDAMVNLDRAFDGLDIVELHDGFDL